MRCRFGVLLCVATLCAASVWGAVKPEELSAGSEGGYTYFRARFAPPEGYKVPAEPQWRGGVPTFRAPLLINDPAWAVPCYARTAGDREFSAWETPWFELTFMGRVKEGAKPKLKLVYPKREGGWGTVDVDVDLSAAAKFDEAATTGTAARTAKQQFGAAQSRWFGYLARVAGDSAGFFEFARVQALRMAGLPANQTGARRDWPQVNLREMQYDTFTGARAIQESLQIDRMLRTGSTTEPRTVDVSTVAGVSVTSHPYEEMMKGKEPVFSALAKAVPADQYMLRFASVAKLQELADLSQQWGGSLLRSVEVGEQGGGLRERLQRQICLPASLLSKTLGPAIIKEVAITGSDPFFREGSDVTVIFDLRSPEMFRSAVDKYWKDTLADEPGAKADTVEVGGVKVERLLAPRRVVSAYRLFDGNMAVYSNSQVAVERVLATRRDSEKSLAAAADFRYMRAVWPQDDKEEDGFLYLSDAFVRRLVGAATRIGEKRRLEAFGAMRLLTNAAMLYGYMNGPGAVPDQDKMVAAGVLDVSDLVMPGGEKIAWDTAVPAALSETYGTLAFMTPLCELPVDKVSESERRDYEQFRDRYQQYWRRYFDPIGVRIKVDKTVSFDVHIMPLIDQSAYNDLKRLTGTKPAQFDLSRVTTDTIARWQVRLDPEAREVRDVRQMVGGMMGRDTGLTDWIGTWAAFWLGDCAVPPAFMHELAGLGLDADDEEVDAKRAQPKMSQLFETPLALGVEVKNKMGLAAFLVALQGMVNSSAPNMIRFIPQDPYKDAVFVKVAPAPGGEIDRELQREQSGADAKSTGPEIALFYGNIGDAWYLSTQRAVLESIVDRQSKAAAATAPRVIDYNALCIVSPGNMRLARPAAEQALGALNRRAERSALWDAWLLYRCGLVHGDGSLDAAARAYLGGPIALPSGGKVSYDAASDLAASSVFGPLRGMKNVTDTEGARNTLADLVFGMASVRAWLVFTPEGLETRVEVERR